MVKGLNIWKEYVAKFCDAIQSNLPNQDFMKSIGLRYLAAEDLIASLKKIMWIMA